MYRMLLKVKQPVTVSSPMLMNQTPKTLNDFGSKALRKAFEKLLKIALLDTVEVKLDSIQFVCFFVFFPLQHVEVGMMLFKHLEGAKSFADYFNGFLLCILSHAPLVLADGLKSLQNIDIGLIRWPTDFLIGRSSRRKVNALLSDVLSFSVVVKQIMESVPSSNMQMLF